MSNFVTAHMEKLKRAMMKSTQAHNKRENENYSNKEIDKTKSHLNISLKPYTNLIDEIDKEIEEYYHGERAIRSDAILLNSFSIGASAEYFDTLSREKQIQYFKDALQFFEDKYGHVVMADCHFDETTPHMHLGVVPLVYDKERDRTTLSSKKLFTRKELYQLHTDYAKHMRSKGFDVVRGVKGSERKYIKGIENYKKAKEQEIKEFLKSPKTKEIAELKRILQNAETKGLFNKTAKITLTPEERDAFVELLPYVNDMAILERGLRDNDTVTKNKDIKIRHLENKVLELQNENDEYEKAKDYLKNVFEVQEIPDFQHQLLIERMAKMKEYHSKAIIDKLESMVKEDNSAFIPFKNIETVIKETIPKDLKAVDISQSTINKVDKTFYTAIRKELTKKSKESSKLQYDAKNKGYKISDNYLKRLNKRRTKGYGHSR